MAQPLISLLIKKSLLKEEEGVRVEALAREKGFSIEEALRQSGIGEREILEVKGEYLRIPTRSVDGKSIPFEILRYIPEESAAHYRFVPIGKADGALEVGIVDPDNIEARDALYFISSKINTPFKLYLISEEDFVSILDTYKGLSGEVTKALSELSGDATSEEADLNKDQTQDLNHSKKVGVTQIIEDAPVTKIVATILRYAIEGLASDIHIEPLAERTRVRFRIDGELHTSLVLPANVHRSVVARIKILSNMKLDEHRKPQDGRFSAKIDGRGVDFRVSTFPTYYGEKVVMRILDKERGVRKLDKSGFSPEHLEMVRRALKRPYGMVLISGPTGSGKSTTLYSMLNELDKETKNILSLEDPVEFNIEGISQSQIRPEINYTFATGLRTTLRQDPDVIMVGEIRDKETAQLAVQAALTGHLVFSTIHTNNAVGVIPRLIDMGVDPFLIAPTLVLTMAQRLVRTLCPGGGKEVPIEGPLKTFVEERFKDLSPDVREKIEPKKSLFEMQVTPDCPNGTRGRMAVFEMFAMDKDLEELILKKGTELEIRKMVRDKGMISIQEDALIKCSQGLIPLEEVNTLA